MRHTYLSFHTLHVTSLAIGELFEMPMQSPAVVRVVHCNRRVHRAASGSLLHRTQPSDPHLPRDSEAYQYAPEVVGDGEPGRALLDEHRLHGSRAGGGVTLVTGAMRGCHALR